ncbi:MAG: hypothetical protein KDB80_07290 [Planctomycetes bacterium]|nr:hypothetical protein [Planctomycetota bacterium]
MLTTLALSLCIAPVPQADPNPPARPVFATPIRLTADGEPLGADRLYPSPRLYDIDRDGQDELVIGDLIGEVRVAERLDGKGPAAWGKLEPFLSGKRALKFHNW